MPDLPIDCPFQMDGGFSDDVDGGRANEVPSAHERGPDEPGGGLSLNKQDDRGGMHVLDRRRGLSVRVRWEDSSRPREMDTQEVKELFDQQGLKLPLTTAYNLEANGKVKHEHGPIVKAIMRACDGQVGNWPRLLPYALWIHASRTHVRTEADHATRANDNIVDIN